MLMHRPCQFYESDSISLSIVPCLSQNNRAQKQITAAITFASRNHRKAESDTRPFCLLGICDGAAPRSLGGVLSKTLKDNDCPVLSLEVSEATFLPNTLSLLASNEILRRLAIIQFDSR